MAKSIRPVLATAVLCLLVSGAAGLVYQVVWMRYLSLFLGNTSYAVVAVLVAFMGGLALGNAWLGARADRVKRPLAFYAWLEIGIALYALVFPYYYELCHHAYTALAKSWRPGSSGLLGLKFIFSLATILIPTVLMGGTLPVMTRLVTRSLGELRERVSTLYFINSLGAVFGCFLADFWWLPALGLQATVLAGAAMNLLAGAVALFVSGWLKEEWTATEIGLPLPTAVHEETFTPVELKLAVFSIGMSGFVAMLYEVVWTRMLALALGSSTHAFSLMLMTFITGIATGAWIVGRWRKLRRSLEAFAWAELALAAVLTVSVWFYDLIPFWFVRIAGLLARKPEAYPLYGLAQATICFAVMFLPTVCLGMTLPLVSRIATAELARTGRSVGTVFSVNTLGTVLGAAITGLLLMPWLGLARTLALGIALNASVGFVVLARERFIRKPTLALAIPLVLVLFAVPTAGAFDSSWQKVFITGLWRQTPPDSLSAYREYARGFQVKYYRDGAGSTVSVNGGRIGDVEHLTLRVNGKADASTTSDVPTQLLSGHIPMLLRPASTNVLVVGLGSGMTCGAVMRHPGVRLDVVEISPEVAEAARLFGPFNDKVLENPRVNLVIEDAKSFLQITDQFYDVIISEPSNPWVAGVAGVFSAEYYETCRARLKPGGLMAQWVQFYETDDRTLETVFATFSSAFPFMSVWQTAQGDLILVGTAQPFELDFAALRQRFNEPAIKSDMERFDLYRLPVLLAREIISPENALVVPSPAARRHSDFYPVLEYSAQRAFFVRQDAPLAAVLDDNRSPRATTLLAQYLQKYPLTEDDLKAFGLYFSTHRLPDLRLFRSLLLRWQTDFPSSVEPLELSAKFPVAGGSVELEAQRMSRLRDALVERAPGEPDRLRLYAFALMQTYRDQRSIFFRPSTAELEAVLERLIEADSANQRIYRLHLAELAWDRGDDDACFRLGQLATNPDVAVGGPVNFELDPAAPSRIVTRMMETLWRSRRIPEAWHLCQEARRQGLSGGKTGNSDPMLEMTCRKVEAFAVQAGLVTGN
jgi:predicted membrane-bound spermidine synthase